MINNFYLKLSKNYLYPKLVEMIMKLFLIKRTLINNKFSNYFTIIIFNQNQIKNKY